MVAFILFCLIIGIFWYAYDTRQRMVNMANAIDQVHEVINQWTIQSDTKVMNLQQDVEHIKSVLAKRRPIKSNAIKRIS